MRCICFSYVKTVRPGAKIYSESCGVLSKYTVITASNDNLLVSRSGLWCFMGCHFIPIQVWSAQVAFVSFLVQLGDVCWDTGLQKVSNRMYIETCGFS